MNNILPVRPGDIIRWKDQPDTHYRVLSINSVGVLTLEVSTGQNAHRYISSMPDPLFVEIVEDPFVRYVKKVLDEQAAS